MKNKSTKLLSVVFAVIMALSMLSVFSVYSFAEDSTDDVIKGETIWAPQFSYGSLYSNVELDDKSSPHSNLPSGQYYYGLNSDANNSFNLYYYMKEYDDENPFMLNNNYIFTKKAKLESNHYYVFTATVYNTLSSFNLTASYTPDGSDAVEIDTAEIDYLGWNTDGSEKKALDIQMTFKTGEITADSCTITINFSGECGSYGTVTVSNPAISSNQGGHTHSMNKNISKPATCTEDGYKGVQCEYCDKINVSETIEKSHTAAEAVIENETPATCTEDGSYDEVIRCSECGEKISTEAKTIPAKGHTAAEAVKENEKAATCTVDGSYDEVIYCSECGEKLSSEAKTITANGHSPSAGYSSETVTKPATCTEEGTVRYDCKCTVCGEVVDSMTGFISATGHNDKNNDGVCDTCKKVIDQAKKDAYDASKATIKIPSNINIGYNEKAKITATVDSLPEGYAIQWFDGDKAVGEKGATITTDNLKSSKTYTIKVVDKDGNAVQEKTVTVNVKTDFFSKIIAIFKNLFGLLNTPKEFK